MGPISVPSTESEQNYTTQQSARRKDIERAFGILKMKFNILNRPSLTADITLMNKILRVCVILHNMVITPRVDQHETVQQLQVFTHHVQVVEEKRVAVKESIHYSVADAVEDEAVAVDQESRMESELIEIPFGMLGAKFKSFGHYMKHMDDLASHNHLKRSISNHFWQAVKIQRAKAKTQRMQMLLDPL